jgi:hypothetical protein
MIVLLMVSSLGSDGEGRKAAFSDASLRQRTGEHGKDDGA